MPPDDSKTTQEGTAPRPPNTRLRGGGTTGTDGGSPKPQQMRHRYLDAGMTYVYVSIEELAVLAMTGGGGSLALSVSAFLVGISLRPDMPPLAQAALIAGAVVVGAFFLAAYMMFFGLVGRIRSRNKLNWWKILSDKLEEEEKKKSDAGQTPNP